MRAFSWASSLLLLAYFIWQSLFKLLRVGPLARNRETKTQSLHKKVSRMLGEKCSMENHRAGSKKTAGRSSKPPPPRGLWDPLAPLLRRDSLVPSTDSPSVTSSHFSICVLGHKSPRWEEFHIAKDWGFRLVIAFGTFYLLIHRMCMTHVFVFCIPLSFYVILLSERILCAVPPGSWIIATTTTQNLPFIWIHTLNFLNFVVYRVWG